MKIIIDRRSSCDIDWVREQLVYSGKRILRWWGAEVGGGIMMGLYYGL